MELLKLRHYIMSKSIWFSKSIAKIRTPYSVKLITGKDYYNIRNNLKVGDILLSHTRGQLSNLFIPDFWSHGAVFYGTLISDTEFVAEATSHGVVLTDLVSFMTSKDYILVLRPTFFESKFSYLLKEYIDRCLGLPYDWEFETPPNGIKNNAFYCFEFCACALEAATGAQAFVPKEFLGMKTFTGTDFTKAINKFSYVWSNNPEWK